MELMAMIYYSPYQELTTVIFPLFIDVELYIFIGYSVII